MQLTKSTRLTRQDLLRIKEAVLYAETHHLDKISQIDLSQQFAIGEDKIQRGFREITGYSVHQYLDVLRFNSAKRLLLDTDKSIKEIAADLQMDPSYFVQFFKKYAQNTPAKYRQDNYDRQSLVIV